MDAAEIPHGSFLKVDYVFHGFTLTAFAAVLAYSVVEGVDGFFELRQREKEVAIGAAGAGRDASLAVFAVELFEGSVRDFLKFADNSMACSITSGGGADTQKQGNESEDGQGECFCLHSCR